MRRSCVWGLCASEVGVTVSGCLIVEVYKDLVLIILSDVYVTLLTSCSSG